MKTLRETILGFYENGICDIEPVNDDVYVVSCNGLKMTTVKFMGNGIVKEFDHCFKETRERKISIQENGDIFLL